jgi:hydrogenase expression/formation protein HypC
MCLGVPGKIVEMYEQGGLLMGKIDFGGVAREVCLAYVPEAKIGDYAVVHVGFALNLLDEAEAQETLALLKEIGAFDEEFGSQPDNADEEILAGGTVAGG